MAPGGFAVAESGKYMLQLKKEQAQVFAGTPSSCMLVGTHFVKTKKASFLHANSRNKLPVAFHTLQPLAWIGCTHTMPADFFLLISTLKASLK